MTETAHAFAPDTPAVVAADYLTSHGCTIVGVVTPADLFRGSMPLTLCQVSARTRDTPRESRPPADRHWIYPGAR